MSVCARSDRGSIELRVADCDDAIESGCCAFCPDRGRAHSGGLKVGKDGGKGGIVVAFLKLSVKGTIVGKQEEMVPVKASSGRTSRSTSCGDAACRRALVRAMLCVGLPNSGLNCRRAMRMLREVLDEE